MDFVTYDNLETYREMTAHEKPEATYKVNDIWIKPPDKGFWFSTDYDGFDTSFGFLDPYLHIHPGGPDIQDAQFDKGHEPVLIQKNWLFYEPKDFHLEIRKGLLPWTKPIYRVWTAYHGYEDPGRRLRVAGRIMYYEPANRLDFVLKYYPSRKYDEDELRKFGPC